MTMSYDSNTTALVETEKLTRAQKTGASVICFFAFFVVYFLMSGPLIWIEDKMKFKPYTKSLHVMYAPLVLVAKSDMSPASDIIKSYVQLFKN